MQQVSLPHAEPRRPERAQQPAGSCLRAAAVLMGCYSAFMFWLAYMSAEGLTGHGSREYGDAVWTRQESDGWTLLTALVIGWVLSVLARGLWRGRLWAWLVSFLAVSGMGLFYLANCTQFGWFSVWLLQIPVMVVLLLVGLSGVRLGSAESEQS